MHKDDYYKSSSYYNKLGGSLPTLSNQSVDQSPAEINLFLVISLYTFFSQRFVLTRSLRYYSCREGSKLKCGHS